MSVTRVRLMSLSEVDFFRILPQAVAPCGFTVQSGTVMVQCMHGSVHIRFSPEAPRRIASLSLPVLRVVVECTDMPEQESRAFLARFDRAFQRGGG